MWMDDIMRALNEAIKLHQGTVLKAGTNVAHPADQKSYVLVGYDGDDAILRDLDGTEIRQPAAEIFDTTAVKISAQEIYAKRRFEQLRKSKLN